MYISILVKFFPNLIKIVNALLNLFEGPVDLGLQLSVGRHGWSCRGGRGVGGAGLPRSAWGSFGRDDAEVGPCG